MKNPVIVAIALFLVGIAACKKDKNIDDAVTPINIITNASWQIDTIGFDADKNGAIDQGLPGGLQPCELDNTLTFNQDSTTGVFDEGALKCDPADEQSIPFTYTLYGDTLINIQGNLPGQLQGDVKILELNNTTLTMSKNIVSTFPVPFDANLIISLKR